MSEVCYEVSVTQDGPDPILPGDGSNTGLIVAAAGAGLLAVSLSKSGDN